MQKIHGRKKREELIVYISFALVVLIGACSKQAEKVYKWSLLGLFILTGFRNPDLGLTDTIIYQRMFATIPALDNIVGYNSIYAWGYTLLNAFVKLFTDKFWVYQIIYAAIVIGIIYIIVEQLELESKEKCLFLFSYFCYRYIWNTWVILRQNLAVIIFWLLMILEYKEKDKKKKIILIVCSILIPACFHSSAWVNTIILLVMFGLSKIKTSIKSKVIPILGIVLYLFGGEIYGKLLYFMQNVIDSRYFMYSTETNTTNSINFIVRLVFYLFFIWKYNINNNTRNKFVLDMMEMMFLIGSINAELVTRMYEYYAIGLYAGMAGILQSFAKKNRFLVLMVYGCGMIIILARFLLITDGGVLANYSLWFGEKIY